MITPPTYDGEVVDEYGNDITDDNDQTNNTEGNDNDATDQRLEDDGIADEDYEPSDQEVTEYCEWLGMDLVHDRCLMWIAREALKAPLPENWRVCYTEDRDAYYFNVRTGESIWDHPMDAYYKALYKQEKGALDKKRKKLRMYSKSLPLVPLVDFFSETVVEDGLADPALSEASNPWVNLPETLCDPIDYKLFHEPVVLPTSGRTVSRHTIINNRWRDPFSREYIENRRLVPNVDKRLEVDSWLSQAVAKYMELVTPNPTGIRRLVRIMPYLVDKDEEVCVKAQNMILAWFSKHTQNLAPLPLDNSNKEEAGTTAEATPRGKAGLTNSTKGGRSGAAGSAVSAIRGSSGRRKTSNGDNNNNKDSSSGLINSARGEKAAALQNVLGDLLVQPEDGLKTLLHSLLSMSSSSSLSTLHLVLTKIPSLSTHDVFMNFSTEVLHVLRLGVNDLNAARSHCTVRTEPGQNMSVKLTNSDDMIALQWVFLLAEMKPAVYVFALQNTEWDVGITLVHAMLTAVPGAADRPATLCALARSLPSWAERLSTAEEAYLTMFMDWAFECGSDVMVPMLHDVCIHGGERLMDSLRPRRHAILQGMLEMLSADSAAHSTMLAHLGAVLVFHEACRMDDFMSTPALAMLIGQNLFPRLTRMQWRPRHFESTVQRLSTLCSTNPVMCLSVMKTGAIDFLLRELGKKKKTNDDLRVRVDSIEVNLRRVEQTHATNNWLILATTAKLRTLEAVIAETTVSHKNNNNSTATPGRQRGTAGTTSSGGVKRGVGSAKKLLPTLGRQSHPVEENPAGTVDDDDDDDAELGGVTRLRRLLLKGQQTRTAIANEKSQLVTTLLSLLMSMRLKIKVRGESVPPSSGPGQKNTTGRSTLRREHDPPPTPPEHPPESSKCALPRI
eukprot:PhM_4_TR17583/c0_g1_i1/m.31271